MKPFNATQNKKNAKVLLRNFKHNIDCKSTAMENCKEKRRKKNFVNLNYFIVIVSYFKKEREDNESGQNRKFNKRKRKTLCFKTTRKQN